jgi:hypothetical protein
LGTVTRSSGPKVAALLEEAEEDLLAFYCFPVDHWRKLRSANPLERVNREIGRRTDVVGIFPNDRSLIRLAASVVIEQNDEWLVGHRYLSNHSLEACSIKKRETTKTERGHASLRRPEQPTIVSTSYTTSWDLTAAPPEFLQPRVPAPLTQPGFQGRQVDRDALLDAAFVAAVADDVAGHHQAKDCR